MEKIIVAGEFDVHVTRDAQGTTTLELTTGPPTIPDEVPPPPPPAPDLFTVELVVGDHTFTYDRALGVDRGDYVDPLGRFSHDSIEVTLPELPAVHVLFRSDLAPGTRREVIIELGSIWDTAPPQAIAYVATIKADGATLHTAHVTQHDWRTRWRWQSAERPVTRTVAELAAAHLIPPYGLSGTFGPTPAPAALTWARYGDRAGIQKWMIATGEYDAIGPVPSCAAHYVCTGSPVSLASMRAMGEAHGSYGMTMRDERTGGLFEFQAYPAATMYSPSGANPFVRQANGDRLTMPDVAHMPDFGYLLFLLTGDSYLLEGAQHTAVWSTLMQPPGQRKNFCMAFAVRAHAWHTRLLAQLTKMTPDAVPAWLLSRATWETELAGDLAFVRTAMASTAPAQSVFSVHTLATGVDALERDTLYFSPWMDDYQCFVMGWLAWMGLDGWLEAFQWKLRADVSRTDGVSGWARAVPSPYHLIVRGPRVAGVAPPVAADWATAWALTQTHRPAASAFGDPDQIQNDTRYYESYTLACLTFGVHLGLPEVAASLAWMAPEFRRKAGPNNGFVDWQWAMECPP